MGIIFDVELLSFRFDVLILCDSKICQNQLKFNLFRRIKEIFVIFYNLFGDSMRFTTRIEVYPNENRIKLLFVQHQTAENLLKFVTFDFQS